MMASGLQREANGLHVRLAAVPESVPEARLRVRRWCERAGVCGRTRDDLLLAASEAVANVVVHAYPGGEGTCRLEMRRDADAIVVSVADRGVGLSGAAPSSGRGLGLGIILRMFPASTLAQTEPGTRVTIRAPAAWSRTPDR